ncbi:Coatomer subunit beta'-2 [Vitis vinifera]|uniref:Coatomer subunit beta' n=1 Tax=Vitis vinifera TaxID=29760 RepID=A0A438HUF1_VITVI|nr:Coatomer subunit beta'-2 [Vitis vinifera]
MPLRLEIKRKLAQRSERVKSVDLHPSEPWILASLYSGTVCIWNYQSQTMAKSFEVTELPVRSAKFIARKQWVVAGADDMFIRVYNYNTMDKVKVFEAHTDYIRCVAVHPTLPYVLSSSDDMLIKLWDWEKGWVCTQIFEGHSHYVMQVTFNPKDTNTFASASLDRTIKIWNLGSPDPNFTLDAHQKGVNCVDYFTGGDKPYLITGSDDHTAKVWDYQTKSCVQTLEGHTHNVSAVCFHPELPIIITGSEDGTVRIWHATTYRLENTLNYGLERVWAVGYMKGSRRVVIGYDEGSIMVKLGREVPVASMDNSGKIIWAKHNEIQTVNIKSVGADFEVTDGERLPLAVKELGTCDLYPQSLKHNPNGRFVVVCGDGEYIIYTALAWRNRSFGSALEFVWSSDGEYAVRESTSKVKIFSKNFQYLSFLQSILDIACHCCLVTSVRLIRRIDVNVKNLYWADSGDLVAIASDTSFYILKYNRDVVTSYLDSGRPVDEQGVEDAFELLHETNERVRTGIWVGDCFIYNNSSWRLNYCVGGEVTTMFHLDRPMYLLGYLANQSRVYLIDKEFNVMGYTLLLSLIEYKTLVMRGDLERANELLPSIPKEHHNSVARFLESRGMIEDALEVATDPDYRFELAMQLGRLEVAKDIATEVQSESKWKQLGELAMSTGKLEMAEECLKHAMDLSGLLLLYSSLGDADGISKLASLAKEQGKNNVAFLCLFMLGKLEECLQLLVDSNRIPEAALMARSYLPSKVSEIVALWRKDLNKVNPKAAESLADPEEYPNLFEDWQVGLAIESKVAETRSIYPPAEEYLNCADRSHINLVEAFRNLQMEEEEPLENGDASHEVQNGEESQEEHNGEEAVVVDADSTDGAVLVNGNEAEEEWVPTEQYLQRTICSAYSLRSLKSLINMLQCLHHVTRSHQDSRSQLYSFPTQEGGGITRGSSPLRFQTMWLKVGGLFKDLLKSWWMVFKFRVGILGFRGKGNNLSEEEVKDRRIAREEYCKLAFGGRNHRDLVEGG